MAIPQERYYGPGTTTTGHRAWPELSPQESMSLLARVPWVSGARDQVIADAGRRLRGATGGPGQHGPGPVPQVMPKAARQLAPRRLSVGGGRTVMVLEYVDHAQPFIALYRLDGGPLHGGQGFLGTVRSGDDRRGHGPASGCAFDSSSRARVACSLRTTTAENRRLTSYPRTASASHAARTGRASKAD